MPETGTQPTPAEPAPTPQAQPEPTASAPAAAAPQRKPDGRSRNSSGPANGIKGGGPRGIQRDDQSTQIDGRALIPEALNALLTQKLPSTALTANDERRLSYALGMSVDEWRKEFGTQLRETASELLTLTRAELARIKPDARAYTLAVLVDKATALEGRQSLNQASVNIQVNNFGPNPRESLIASLVNPRIAQAEKEANGNRSGAQDVKSESVDAIATVLQ